MKPTQVVSLVFAILLMAGCTPAVAEATLPVATLYLATPTTAITSTPSSSPTPVLKTAEPPKPTRTAVPPTSTLTAEPTQEPLLAVVRMDSLVWDPSSRWLAYTTTDGRAWLQTKNAVEGVEITGILAPRPSELKIVWSPKGDALLVYGRWGEGYPGWTAIWLVPVDSNGAGQAKEILAPTSPVPPVDQNEGIVYAVSWAADGSQFAYSFQGEAWIYTLQSEKSVQVSQLTINPLRPPVDPSVPPFDGVREVFYSPGGRYLAIGLSCDCPPPYSGVAVVELETLEVRLIGGGRLTGWSPDGSQLIFEFVTGDFDENYIVDIYGADPASGKIINLTRSNPGHDELLEGWDALKPAAYHTSTLRWSPGGEYLYTTIDYRLADDPAFGFMVRQSPEKVSFEKRANAESWYLFPAWLKDGQVAYVEAKPGHPKLERWTGDTFEIKGLVYGPARFEADGMFITNAVWAPDGSAVALMVGLDRVLQIIPLGAHPAP